MNKPLLSLFSTFILTCTSTVSAQPAGYADFELVESIPVGTVLDNPDIRNTRDVWIEMINGSKASLDIEQFYVSNKAGEQLEDVIRAIEGAADRGVNVRLIADSRMYKTYPETIERLSKRKNIATRIIDFGKLAGGIIHAKYFIVDGREIFLGSQNFDWRALQHIHELGLRIAHQPIVAVYADIFELDWRLAKSSDPLLGKSSWESKHYAAPFFIVENGTDTLECTPTCSPRELIPDTSLWDEPNIVKLIDGAKSEVLLQFLSYSPEARDKSRWDALDDALRRAASRGTKVRMIISDWEQGTPSEQHLKDLAKISNIEVKFSAIPEWSGGYISFARVEHCKFIVVDGAQFWLGTSNAEKSYFHTSRNLGIIVKNSKLSEMLKRVFLKSCDGPYTQLIKQEVRYEKRKHGE